MYRIYLAIRFKSKIKSINPVTVVVNEVNMLMAAFFSFIFVNLKTGPNLIDFISFLYTFTICILLLSLDSKFNLIIIAILIIINDFWDIVDGFVARYLSKESTIGYYFDVVTQSFNYDLVLIAFYLYVFKLSYNIFSLIMGFAFVVILTFRLDRVVQSLFFLNKVKFNFEISEFPRNNINIKNLTLKNLLLFIINYVYHNLVKIIYFSIILNQLNLLDNILISFFSILIFVLFLFKRFYTILNYSNLRI